MQKVSVLEFGEGLCGLWGEGFFPYQVSISGLYKALPSLGVHAYITLKVLEPF